jgi:hypothetical protein
LGGGCAAGGGAASSEDFLAFFSGFGGSDFSVRRRLLLRSVSFEHFVSASFVDERTLSSLLTSVLKGNSSLFMFNFSVELFKLNITSFVLYS